MFGEAREAEVGQEGAQLVEVLIRAGADYQFFEQRIVTDALLRAQQIVLDLEVSLYLVFLALIFVAVCFGRPAERHSYECIYSPFALGPEAPVLVAGRIRYYVRHESFDSICTVRIDDTRLEILLEYRIE